MPIKTGGTEAAAASVKRNQSIDQSIIYRSAKHYSLTDPLLENLNFLILKGRQQTALHEQHTKKCFYLIRRHRNKITFLKGRPNGKVLS